jgi:acyl-CoA synthetase (AMP-forming)/AMP-acid ligase II
MMISGGENVFPAEVESVLAELPEILEAAVIGVPSDRWGETVKAVVVLRSGAVVKEQEVIDFCRKNLAHYKCPTTVEIVSALPHNASGKLLKADLRKQYAPGVSA